MTVGRDYLMKQPSRPSVPKLFLDTRIVPGAVNIAGSVEVALDRAAQRTGLRPLVILIGGAVATSLIAVSLRRRRDIARVVLAESSCLKSRVCSTRVPNSRERLQS